MVAELWVEKYTQQRPAAVMTRGALEYAFADEHLDEIFRTHATTQYEHRLLFWSMVRLLSAVVMRRHRSVNAAYHAEAKALGVSLSSVYDKLNHTDLSVTEALLRQTAVRLKSVMSLWPTTPSPIAGYVTKIVDGNHLAGTEHRLEVLRAHGSAALPGIAVVVLDHATGLMTQVFGSPDGHQSERALIDRVVETVQPGELYLADRHYCTFQMLEGIAARGSCFIIRHHQQIALKTQGELRSFGMIETGEVFEQETIVNSKVYRLITLKLNTPTEDGETEIRLFSNLPREKASAPEVARAYRQRWRLENTFQEVTVNVQCELNTLGYPNAALLTFSLALCICNALHVVMRAMEQTHALEQQKKVEEEARKQAETQKESAAAKPSATQKPAQELSSYYIVSEINLAYDGMDIVLDQKTWQPLRAMTPSALARWLTKAAQHADWKKYLKAKRGPKKPVTPILGGRRNPHRSTYKLLLQKRNLPKAPT
jgi:hypothetical protein